MPQAPDGTIWKVATSAKKDTGPATRQIDQIVLLLGVGDMAVSKRFYVDRGLTVAKSFGRKYVEFATASGPVKLALYGRGALAKDAGVPPDGTGSHGLAIDSDAGPFTDPDGFAWEGRTVVSRAAQHSEHVLALVAAGPGVAGGAGGTLASRARVTPAGPATARSSVSVAARRTIVRVTSSPASEQHLRDLARLRRVRDRIDREYAEPLDVEALARGAHISAGHLSREFRLAYGESPYSYLMTRRIERAMALLRRGDLSVTEVCFAVGCSSLGHLQQQPLHRAGRCSAQHLPARRGARDGGDAGCAWRNR